MTLRPRKTALSFGLLAFVAVAVSCREPTQITVVIRTGEKCTDLSGVDIVVGPDQKETQTRFEQQFTAASTHECDASGLVGTLVVTPGGQGGTIVVAAGVRVAGAAPPDPATCAKAENAKSCIVARRSFSFLSHTSLTLPIELDPLCVGTVCDPASTCFKGACVNASVTCNGSDCGLPQENPGQGTGGGNEAGSSDGAYDADLDGMSFEDVVAVDAGNDGAMIVDAGPDADAGDGATGPYPPCGNSGFTYCYAPSYGTRTARSCDGSDPAGSCCHCVCTVNSQVVSCNSGPLAVPQSCSPTCP